MNLWKRPRLPVLSSLRSRRTEGLARPVGKEPIEGAPDGSPIGRFKIDQIDTPLPADFGEFQHELQIHAGVSQRLCACEFQRLLTIWLNLIGNPSFSHPFQNHSRKI